MFALIAVLCFLADLLGLTLGDIELVTLGLLFIALHLALGPAIAARWGRRV